MTGPKALLPAGVSMGDVARATNLTHGFVSRIFSGDRYPSLRTSERIAGYLGISIDTWAAAVRELRPVQAEKVSRPAPKRKKKVA